MVTTALSGADFPQFSGCSGKCQIPVKLGSGNEINSAAVIEDSGIQLLGRVMYSSMALFSITVDVF